MRLWLSACGFPPVAIIRRTRSQPFFRLYVRWAFSRFVDIYARWDMPALSAFYLGIQTHRRFSRG